MPGSYDEIIRGKKMKEYKFYWVKYKQNSVENKTVFRAENMKKAFEICKKRHPNCEILDSKLVPKY